MFRLRENLRTVINQDGAVLLDVVKGKIVRCNQTGATIVELLTRSLNEQQITEEFSRLYDIPPGSAYADVRAFLTSLESQGLLRRETVDKSQE
jgi:Ethanolamine utilization protein EutJ (predicted chaperonin)